MEILSPPPQLQKLFGAPHMDRKISIAATFSAAPVVASVRVWSEKAGEPIDVEVLPYNQIFQSLLAQQPTELMVVAIRWEDWTDGVTELRATSEIIAKRTAELADALNRYAEATRTPVFVAFTPHSLRASSDLLAATNRAESKLRTRLPRRRISVISADSILTEAELAEANDEVALKTGHVPYTAKFFSVLGQRIAREYYRHAAPPTKVVVVDADNTLWTGVCGEDSASELSVGPGHITLQERLLALRERGILLGLCSKNQPGDVWAAMERAEGMLLSRSDFTTHRINWHAKSENILDIAAELNLHPSSFVFLDDNPIECGEVRVACPDALTLQVPAEDKLSEFVHLAWPLDLPATTDADNQRATQYEQQRRRTAQMQRSSSIEEFLQQLELDVSFTALSRGSAERAAQLMQRTSQFNLTGHKQSVAELLESDHELKLIVSAKDKFGDYGQVGLVLGHIVPGTLVIDGLWLSCRALGRGVEFEILKRIALVANEQQQSKVLLRIVATDRNTPAQKFIDFLALRFGGKLHSPEARTREVELTASALSGLNPLGCAAVSITPGDHSSSTRESMGNAARSSEMQKIINASRSSDAMHQFVRAAALPRPESHETFVPPITELENSICQICAEVLHLEKVGLDDSLTALGGSSLHTVQIHSRLAQELSSPLSITQLYALATIRDIVDAVAAERTDQPRPQAKYRAIDRPAPTTNEPIAIVGMAGKFPGASNVRKFWDNLAAGRSSIVDIPDDQLNLPLKSTLRQNPNLVRRAAGLADVSGFDAKFFKIYPKEAAVMDPQHRLLLESSWHALEDAGYIPDQIDASVGVFAGCYMNTYMLASLTENPALVQSLANSFHGGDLHTELGNDKDYLATRIAYLLNLRGPALTIQTACSTSLVAIAHACQSLRNNQCDFALAGGATLKLPQNRGYLYTEGGMVSPDGVVRTFDADARGTVFGEGVGIVVLRRLSDAIRDRDDIYAVIKGCGVNNDGRQKMGYAAPSVDGQAAAISLALEDASVPADTITYVEAHGTGTSLGDPIEIDALSRSYRWHSKSNRNQYCAIGSVKTNIGHLDVAAGVTGLIKICWAMRHGQIPPSLNYTRPNPNIDFANSPFYVNTELREWKPGENPLRAGLSSFGVGGTNAHIIVEQAPSQPTTQPPADAEDIEETELAEPTLLTWSAASEQALQQATDELCEHIHRNTTTQLRDVAFTLASGRKTFNYTRICVARSREEAIELLGRIPGISIVKQVRRGRPTTWLFPGQGSQHPAMAHELYRKLPRFSEQIDKCCEILTEYLPFDLRKHLRDPHHGSEGAFSKTSVAQPAIFVVSYALAKYLMELGIQPTRMIGHSVGEFVAATLAGVFTLEDALRCVAYRGRAMQELPPGEMLAVRMAAGQLARRLPDDLDLAAANSPELCVVSGPTVAIESFTRDLESDGIVSRRLHTSHAFHSRMMAPVVETLEQHIALLNLRPADIPIVSTLTGQPLTDAEATSANYWARHLREPVRFSDAATSTMAASESVLIEVGPGQTLSTLVKQCQTETTKHVALSLLPHAKQSTNAYPHLLESLGKLWQSGIDFDREKLVNRNDARRVHLPGYPFQHQHYWLDSVAYTQDTPVTNEDSPKDNVGLPKFDESADKPLRAAAPNSIGHSNSGIAHQVVQQQLDIMTRQLKAWRG